MKTQHKRVIFFLIISGYIVIWVIAPYMARKSCADRANRMYAQGLKNQEEFKKLTIKYGQDPNELRPMVNPNSPRVETGLVLPILPGVLLLNNSYNIGPLWGNGQISIFLFYGFGVVRVLDFTTWIS